MRSALSMILANAASSVLAVASLPFVAAGQTDVQPAPGTLIDDGGYHVHLHCTGEGIPTVILEAGPATSPLTGASSSLASPG